jgi:NTE family protein
MATPDPVPLSEDALAKLQPVRPIPADTPREAPHGVGLCLSGGGYRAMLFHVGAIKRLNDAGRLAELDRISSVSGGSITAATLALHWSRLEWRNGVATNLDTLLTAPVRALAGHTLDVWSVLKGISPFGTISEHIAHAYRQHPVHRRPPHRPPAHTPQGTPQAPCA